MLILLSVINELEAPPPVLAEGAEAELSIEGVAAKGHMLLLHEQDERYEEMRELVCRLLNRMQGAESGHSMLSGARPAGYTANVNRKISDLTPRETEVLQLSVEGLSYESIAERLSISVNTVRYYVRRLHLKLDVHNRAAAINEARKLGLV